MMKALLLFPRGTEKEGGMDCQKFKEILIELAGDCPLDTPVRRKALAHAGVCEPCARRLEVERALTARITEFSRATGDLHASKRVRQQLRAAVAGLKTTPTATAEAASVLAFSSVRRTNRVRRGLVAVAAMAAAIL